MATFKRQTYKYKETNIGKYKTVKHYSLEFTTDKVLRLSKKIKISKDQDFAKSTPCYWIELHNGKKFIKPRLTGLFKTKLSYIYYGDVGAKNRKEHTLLFRFSKNGDELTILYFEGYFSKITDQLIKCIL